MLSRSSTFTPKYTVSLVADPAIILSMDCMIIVTVIAVVRSTGWSVVVLEEFPIDLSMLKLCRSNTLLFLSLFFLSRSA